MKKSLKCLSAALILGISMCFTAQLHAAEAAAGISNAILPPNSRLAIIGDSITEQKIYSKYIETYLLACAGRKDLNVFQFGWGGETANGFIGRLENDLSTFNPTVVTLCYGMNDGGYRTYTEDIGKGYEKAMRVVLEKLKGIGVAQVVIGSPGAVDTKYFGGNPANFQGTTPAEGYNESLKQFRNIDEKLALETKNSFADVHTALIESMKKAKKEKGDEYDVCGRDGIHPSANGQLVMAYAFLKALGCDGKIAEITVDMKDGATASDGHKVLSAANGKVAIESEKYPFCFKVDQSLPGILPFVPFNQDLNRFILKVKNLDAAKAKVTWGAETKEFTKEQLEAGINLAAEFSKTPFDDNFAAIFNAVQTKQNLETQMIKGIITQFRSFADYTKNDAELKTAFDNLKSKLIGMQSKLDANEKAAIVPVKYTIEVVPQP